MRAPYSAALIDSSTASVCLACSIPPAARTKAIAASMAPRCEAPAPAARRPGPPTFRRTTTFLPPFPLAYEWLYFTIDT